MEIYFVSAGTGYIGISPMPGRSGAYDADLASIVRWQTSLVLTMTSLHELQEAGAETIGDDLARHGIVWRHLPVPDFGPPPEETARQWPDAAAEAHAILDAGGRVLTHCYGGCGRSGMASLRLLIERGEAPDAALQRLRTARPCAVETDGQFRWAAESLK